jgi:predicted nucleotide-binding protein
MATAADDLVPTAKQVGTVGHGGAAFRMLAGAELGRNLGGLFGHEGLGAAVGAGGGTAWNLGVAPIVNSVRLAGQNASRTALARALTGEPGDQLAAALAKRQAAQRTPVLVTEEAKRLFQALMRLGVASMPAQQRYLEAQRFRRPATAMQARVSAGPSRTSAGTVNEGGRSGQESEEIAGLLAFRHIAEMGEKFHGSHTDLAERLVALGLEGDWEAQPNSVMKFKCRDRAGLLWSQTKGTIWFDGPSPQKDNLSAKVSAALSDGAPTHHIDSDSQIFVVHGRDHDSRDQLELALRRLGLEPFILQVTGGGGDTLIEALERMIGKTARSAFGIVLVTPDDLGYLKSEKPEDAKPRARQNVIMEMGMLLASLTRKRCAILQRGFVEMPSNMGGVITIPFNDHVREAVPKLVQRLQEAGFKLDPAAIGQGSS